MRMRIVPSIPACHILTFKQIQKQTLTNLRNTYRRMNRIRQVLQRQASLMIQIIKRSIAVRNRMF